MLTEFMNGAKGLTKNPLGIIALFISLIYGFACIVLSTGLNKMYGHWERLPLIFFIILFPILVFGGFIYLVVKNHQNLYAPSDYKDEKNFFNNKFQDNKSIPAEEIAENQNYNVDPAVADLLLKYGSITGLFGIYAVSLALEHNVTFTLENLEFNADLLSKEYTNAFLVATLSVGIFDANETNGLWNILDIDPIIKQKIKENVYQSAEKNKNERNTTYLYDQLFSIEHAFKSASAHKPSEETNKDKKEGGIEEAEVVE